MSVDRYESGWPGHFMHSRYCFFRRRTELTASSGRALLVSTVGDYVPEGETESVEVGADRYFETMVFLMRKGKVAWRELAAWGIGDQMSRADAMHETAVEKMTAFIESASDQEWNEFIGRAWSEEDEEE